MRSLSPRDLLEIWERGVGQRPLQRALELLAAACLEDSPEALAALTIGERDGILLTLRESTFGPEMAGLISCVRCNTQLELTFKATDLRPACVATPESEFSMSIAGYELRFRLPDSLDLSVVAAAEFPRSRRMLLDRCMLAACRDGLPTTSDQLPEEVVDAVAQRMAEADPLAEVQLAISCTTCGHRW